MVATDGGDGQPGTEDVTVTVTNEEEVGVVTLSQDAAACRH